ncbi:MAG: hypothetical protein ACFFAN_01135 [Promethearchaeota archaeon]
MHFLKKLIHSPILEDPAKNHMDVHRHYYRYSKGDFIGPMLKIAQTKSKIMLKGSHEYEDLIQEVVANKVFEDKIDIKGVLITGSDISNIIRSLGLDWKLKKSTGKTKNFKVDILDTISKKTLIDSIEAFRKTSYLLLSFNLNPNCKVTTKTRIPQPSREKIEESDINKRIQFCSGVIPNDDLGKNIKFILDLALEDFKSDLPENWKNLIIFNNYKIEEIELPKSVKNTNMLRIMAIRKGKIIRTVDINGNLIEKQYSIRV